MDQESSSILKLSLRWLKKLCDFLFLVCAGGEKPLPRGSGLQDVAGDRDEDCERVSLERRPQQGGAFSLDEMAPSIAVTKSRRWVIAAMGGEGGVVAECRAVTPSSRQITGF